MKVEKPGTTEFQETSEMSRDIAEDIIIKNEDENDSEYWEEAKYDSDSESDESEIPHSGKKRRFKDQKKSGQIEKNFFSCDICDSKFTSRPLMNQHVSEAHEGKKPLVCIICDTSSSDRNALNRHIANVHDETKVKREHECTVCDGRFENTYLLKQHMLLVHEKKKPFKCKICNNSFSQ